MINDLIYKTNNKTIINMKYCMKYAEIYREDVEHLLIEAIGELLNHGSVCGYTGNLWKSYLAEQIAMDTNAYALACENRGEVTGTITEVALFDIKKIYACFMYDLHKFKENYPKVGIEFLFDFKQETVKLETISCKNEAISKLTKGMNETQSAEEMQQVITRFYKEYGVGDFGLFKAFRVNDLDENKTSLLPIENIEPVFLNDLVGYEIAKKKLISNTEAFLEGRPANNCLLFGDAGTGKSSSIKGILNEYYEQGLRIVEIYKYQFHKLNDIIQILKDRNYKFIIYMDDLSFEDFEVEYKYLKGVIEGGIGCKASNILIYATSNRRHLIRENYSDKEEIREDMHTSDTVQEKLSLVARFGVSIFFCRPNRKEFQKIVTTLANRYHIEMKEEDLLYEANRWELAHAGLSGRTAKQFIDYIRGENKN